MDKKKKSYYTSMSEFELRREANNFFRSALEAGFSDAECIEMIEIEKPELVYAMNLMGINLKNAFKWAKAAKRLHAL